MPPIEKPAADKPFMVYWANTIFPAIKADFERLQGTTPKRIAKKQEKKEKKDPCHEKVSDAVEEVKEKGERRNAYLNLAWTGPIDNSLLQEKITLGKVENMAADMFLRSLPADGAPETAPQSL